MELEIERTLSLTRRNELEAYTASCFRRVPAFSNYKLLDVRRGVHALAAWVTVTTELVLTDETIFAVPTIEAAVADGLPSWSRAPRRNIASMLSRYGQALQRATPAAAA